MPISLVRHNFIIARIPKYIYNCFLIDEDNLFYNIYLLVISYLDSTRFIKRKLNNNHNEIVGIIPYLNINESDKISISALFNVLYYKLTNKKAEKDKILYFLSDNEIISETNENTIDIIYTLPETDEKVELKLLLNYYNTITHEISFIVI